MKRLNLLAAGIASSGTWPVPQVAVAGLAQVSEGLHL